jgi:hypothetical protein
VIAMSAEGPQIGAGLSTGSGNRLSFSDAISSFLNILINHLWVIPEKVISDYRVMGWESVNNLLLIKEFTGIVFPLIVLSLIYKLKKTSIGLCLTQLILVWFMYTNLVDVDEHARQIGATNVSAFYLSYAESLLFIVLISSVIQGLFHLVKEQKKWFS